MQRKYRIVLAVAFLLIGLTVGWLAADRIARDREQYAVDWLLYARHVQAKERANLVRLLADKEVQKAEDILSFLLNDNFKEYADSAESKERKKACELLKFLGPNFVASTQQTGPNEPKSHRVLVESIRSATRECGDLK